MIRSFRDRETEKIFRRELFPATASRRWQAIGGGSTASGSTTKRICFRWVEADAVEVEIVDYH